MKSIINFRQDNIQNPVDIISKVSQLRLHHTRNVQIEQERQQKERERQKRERKQRDREQRKREQREKEQREREQREKEQREREQREREQREREQREREQREREQTPTMIDLFTTKNVENIATSLANIMRDCGLTVDVYLRNIEISDIQKSKAELGRFLFICCSQMFLESDDILSRLPMNKYILYQLNNEQRNIMNPFFINLVKNSKHTYDYSELNLTYYPLEVKDKVSYLASPVVDIYHNQSLVKYDLNYGAYKVFIHNLYSDTFIKLKQLTYNITKPVSFINQHYLTNRFNYTNLNNGDPIKRITTFKDLIILYNINRLPYYINSIESFYKLYPDFDLVFYKNKYYQKTTLSDIKIMYDFHTVNEYKKRLYNDKIKIVIYTPRLYEKCGGIKALHVLAQKINNLKHKYIYAKIYCYDGSKYLNNYCNDFANPFEINDNTIVIYPEIISGNPLNAKHVMRWILLELDIEMGSKHYLNWNKKDIVYHWEPNTTKNVKQLAIPFVDNQFRNYNSNTRAKTCFLMKKGHLFHDLKNIKKMHPDNSIKLDNMSLDDIVKIFNESHTFYCYDPNTFYILSATLCGCITVVYPIKNIECDTYFKNRIMYIDNFIYNSGIAYGNSYEQITHAKNTLGDSRANLNTLLSKYDANVNKFIEEIYEYFTKNKKLTTIEDVYY